MNAKGKRDGSKNQKRDVYNLKEILRFSRFDNRFLLFFRTLKFDYIYSFSYFAGKL